MVESVFEILKEKDVVIGPCKDGGYYLLGMSGICPRICLLILTGAQARVFEQTMEKIQKNNLSYDILKTLVDIDTIEDLYNYSPHRTSGKRKMKITKCKIVKLGRIKKMYDTKHYLKTL